MDYRCFNLVFLDVILESEVLNEIKLLNVSIVSGLDEVFLKVVKVIVNYIVKFFMYIFNLFFFFGIIFNVFKIVCVILVYKVNSKENFVNYRLILVLLCFFKIFEKLMYKRVIIFFNKNNILLNN